MGKRAISADRRAGTLCRRRKNPPVTARARDSSTKLLNRACAGKLLNSRHLGHAKTRINTIFAILESAATSRCIAGMPARRKGSTNGLKGKLNAACRARWNSSTPNELLWNTQFGFGDCVSLFVCRRLTTSARTRVLTLSPVSGEMSEPNCTMVVRNLRILANCLASSSCAWLADPEVKGTCRHASKCFWYYFTQLIERHRYFLAISNIDRKIAW